MILIMCVDDHMGVSFNHRRLSKDRKVREHMLNLVESSPLWMTPYTARQFEEEQYNFHIADGCQDLAREGDYIFVELASDLPAWWDVEKLYVYHWNCAYPYDEKLEIPEGFHVTNIEEFDGYSHEKITFEIYERN